MASTRSSNRLILFIAVSAAILAAVAAVVIAQGMVVIDVAEAHGTDVHLRVPAILGHMALAFLPEQQWQRMGGRTSRHVEWGPALGQLGRALRKLPDGTVLVQVDGPDESVQIEKRGGALRILVDSTQEEIRIEVPVSLVTSALKRIDRAAHSDREEV